MRNLGTYILVSTLGLLTISCGSDDSEQNQSKSIYQDYQCGPHECDPYFSDDTKEMAHVTNYAATVADRGFCNQYNQAELIFIADENQFYSCQRSGWVAIGSSVTSEDKAPQVAETADELTSYQWLDEKTGRTWELVTTEKGTPWRGADREHICAEYGMNGPSVQDFTVAYANGLWLHYGNTFTIGHDRAWLVDVNDPGFANIYDLTDLSKLNNNTDACLDGSCATMDWAAIYCYE